MFSSATVLGKDALGEELQQFNTPITLYNTNRARGLQYLVGLSVCYQRVQCHTGFILKMAILIKMLRSKVMA